MKKKKTNNNHIYIYIEWAQCMGYLGITIPESEMDRLYQMIDFDNSGHIGEREFCEWFSSCY